MTDAVKATNEDKPSSPWVHPSERVLDPSKIDKSLLDRMPDPTGWRILVLPYKGKGKTEGGVLLPDQILANQEISTQVGYVLKVGPLAYEDKDKFPLGRFGYLMMMKFSLRYLTLKTFYTFEEHHGKSRKQTIRRSFSS
jgi:hypothetical protein